MAASKNAGGGDLPPELRDRPARRPGQEPSSTVTLDAYLRMKQEYEELTTAGREDLVARIKRAREFGDLKENAEYHAAKDEQGLMEARIRTLKELLRDPEIVEAAAKAEAVGPGMLVTVRPLDEDDPEDEMYLLAEHAEERVPQARTVTTTSPLGAALLGAAEGDDVAYEAPVGTVRFRIVTFGPPTG